MLGPSSCLTNFSPRNQPSYSPGHLKAGLVKVIELWKLTLGQTVPLMEEKKIIFSATFEGDIFYIYINIDIEICIYIYMCVCVFSGGQSKHTYLPTPQTKTKMETRKSANFWNPENSSSKPPFFGVKMSAFRVYLTPWTDFDHSFPTWQVVSQTTRVFGSST